MTPRTPTLLALAAALLLGTPARPSDWPRFRGPNGTGVSGDKDVPVTFTDKANLLWKVAIPGVGNSSPVVCKGRVFLLSAAKDASSRMILCLDARSGKTLWTERLPGRRARIHSLSSWASSTPAVDGARVYAAFWDGRAITLYAYDLDGKFVWKHPVGSFQSQHGAGASPVVYGGRLFYLHDQDGDSEVLCLDAKTGKELWRKPRKAFRACYSTPLLLDSKDGPQLIVVSTAGVTSFDPKDGSVNWDYGWTFERMALRTVSSPVFTHGLVIANSGDGSGARSTVAVKVGGKGDVTKTNLAWETTKRSMPYVPSMLARGDYLYSVNDFGIAFCYEARTGKQVWQKRVGGKVSASPVLIDGKIYAVDQAGNVSVFAAAPSFKLLGESNVDEGVQATPAVADNRLYIRGSTHLFCIGKK